MKQLHDIKSYDKNGLLSTVFLICSTFEMGCVPYTDSKVSQLISPRGRRKGEGESRVGRRNKHQIPSLRGIHQDKIGEDSRVLSKPL